MELMRRAHDHSPCTQDMPLGPVGTDWCLVPYVWYNQWKKYVGSDSQTQLQVQVQVCHY